MNSYLTVEEIDFFKECLVLSYDTLFKIGPNQKEHYYQLLLEENLRVNGYRVIKEKTFQCTYSDINNEPCQLGHGTNFRTDLEIGKLGLLLELKQSSSPSTDTHMSQLRSYMIHRDDIRIGAVVNFISKETKTNSNAYVEITIIKKTGNMTSYGNIQRPQLFQCKPLKTDEIPAISEYVIFEQ
jgi:hypothetical protein